MNRIMQVLLFLLVNTAGWYMASVIFVMAIKMDVFPHLPDGPLAQKLSLMVLSVSPLVSIASGLISVGYFFARGEARTWLILAPLYIPALYSILVLVYFNYASVG
jgi:hypothetical protein